MLQASSRSDATGHDDKPDAVREKAILALLSEKTIRAAALQCRQQLDRLLGVVLLRTVSQPPNPKILSEALAYPYELANLIAAVSQNSMLGKGKRGQRRVT